VDYNKNVPPLALSKTSPASLFRRSPVFAVFTAFRITDQLQNSFFKRFKNYLEVKILPQVPQTLADLCNFVEGSAMIFKRLEFFCRGCKKILGRKIMVERLQFYLLATNVCQLT
jgi:hypothetical protein